MTTSDRTNSESSLVYLRNVFAAGGFDGGIGKTLALRGVSADPGTVVIEGSPTADHYNPQGVVHGGYFATLLDAAMALAVQTKLDLHVQFSTINLNVTYLKSMTDAIGVVRAEGIVLHLGRTLSLAEAKIVDKDGRVYAHANGTFQIARGIVET